MSKPRTDTPQEGERIRDLLLATAYQTSFTRRSAIKALFGAAAAGVLFANPVRARAADATAETKEALANAQAEFDKVQKQLDDISAQYQKLAEQQSKTIGQIEDVQKKIDDTQAQIDKKQKELDDKQGVLADRVAQSYKSGDNRALTLLLSSSSFEELISNGYYVNKVNASDRDAIDEVNKIQAELKQEKSDLEGQKTELEGLKEKQASQLTQMQAKQDEVQTTLSGLSQDVKDLINKRDAEILAAAQAEAEEAERQRQAAAAAAAAKKNNSSSGGGYVAPGSGQTGTGKATQQAVVSACHSVPSPGANYCARWVSLVFQRAGIGYVGGNANNMYANWCTYSSKDDLKIGMIVAVSTYSKNYAGRVWGHVGIYVGNNQIMENIGPINTQSIDSWCRYYGDTVTPRWGWALGVNLEG